MLLLLLMLYAETVEFHHGQTVRLLCNTTYRNYVQWDYQARSNSKTVGIYENGQLDESYERFSVEYPLIIRSATEEDSGYYTCVENAGSGDPSVIYHLIYKGSVLSCVTNSQYHYFQFLFN